MKETNDAEVRGRARLLRMELGLTQTEFAERMGLTRSVINNLERGLVEPKEYLIHLIIKTYGVREPWLREGEGEMFGTDALDVLATAIGRYGLTNKEVSIMLAFLQMEPEDRAVLVGFFEGVHAAFEGLPDPPPSEEEVEEAEAEYEGTLKHPRRGAYKAGGSAS